jgi:hypothetical protein
MEGGAFCRPQAGGSIPPHQESQRHVPKLIGEHTMTKLIDSRRVFIGLSRSMASERDDRRKWILPTRTWPVKYLYEVLYLNLSLPVHEQRQTFLWKGTTRRGIDQVFRGYAINRLNEENVELDLVSITLVEATTINSRSFGGDNVGTIVVSQFLHYHRPKAIDYGAIRAVQSHATAAVHGAYLIRAVPSRVRRTGAKPS